MHTRAWHMSACLSRQHSIAKLNASCSSLHLERLTLCEGGRWTSDRGHRCIILMCHRLPPACCDRHHCRPQTAQCRQEGDNRPPSCNAVWKHFLHCIRDQLACRHDQLAHLDRCTEADRYLRHGHASTAEEKIERMAVRCKRVSKRVERTFVRKRSRDHER